MEEIIKFLGQSPAFFVGTTDEDGHPRVRPFSFVMEYNGKLTFTTNTTKAVYRQLQHNPYIEICSFNPSGEWMRISGRAVFTDDRAAKEKVFEVMPALLNIYKSADDPVITCFYMENGRADIYDMSSMNSPKRTIPLE